MTLLKNLFNRNKSVKEADITKLAMNDKLSENINSKKDSSFKSEIHNDKDSRFVYSKYRINENIELKVKYFKGKGNKRVSELVINPKGDWIDLRNLNEVELKAGEITNIKLGIGIQLPEGYEALVRPRSSTAKKWGLLHASSGIIDWSYRGDNDQIAFGVYATRDVKIPRNTRICQFRIQKSMGNLKIVKVDKFEAEDRGGFGSTGDN